jgi:SLT domain-containing protein
MMPDAIRS